ncbi:MAG TPA: hypothetical protein PKM65_01140 [Spirochaetota bacterium]|nr:hypothetical protein [Spirochaetota bacterium]HNT11578.1 hypothetical protein [Spirochaetota bacterium]HNV49175.1 hypothetical protein [Spirochaetota bacterium]HOS39267.1 hypothetical protein [Spirochaetota bacterium]HPU89679.1 hypothetical protein [Spirochaetota bacterium]
MDITSLVFVTAGALAINGIRIDIRIITDLLLSVSARTGAEHDYHTGTRE